MFSCTFSVKDEEVLTINGKVRSANYGFIYLELQTPQGYLKIDSSKLDNDLGFFVEAPKGSEDIYRINFFGKQKVNVVIGEHDISVEADGMNADGYFSGQGSSEIEVISQVNQLGSNFKNQERIIVQKMRSAQMNKDSITFFPLQDSLQALNEYYNDQLKDYIQKEHGSLTALMLLEEYFQIEPNMDFYEGQMKLLQENSGKHWQVKELEKTYFNIKKVSTGSRAPDFLLPDPDGGIVKLSDFHGKYLFLDFWASWCQPCRMENPQFVKVYDRFKGTQFEILGVSFDKKKENWLKAIEKDGLEWIHVSDLLYFDSEMIDLYNITSVPTTFLLDPDGVIIAKNIHADELEEILEAKLR